MTKTYYTVIRSGTGSKAKFAQAPDYEVQEFSGTFADHGEASQKFRAQYPGAEHLKQKPFGQKVRRHQQDLIRLKSWTGK